MKIETRSITLELLPNGVIYSETKEDWDEPDTLEVAKENLEAIASVVDGKRHGLLTKLPNTHLPKEVVDYYHTVDPGQVATALLVSSFGTRVMGNLFLKIARNHQSLTTPVKMFSKREAAEAWLVSMINQESK